MRFGINSGPVTAGVLIGERTGRVHLFGDTMNTAARMESTGERHRIHVSESTAELLRAAGKHRWLEARPDTVLIKGKGKLKTYWITRRSGSRGKGSGGKVHDSTGRTYSTSTASDTGSLAFESEVSCHSGHGIWNEDDDDSVEKVVSSFRDNKSSMDLQKNKTSRLVEWHVELLVGLLKLIVARRGNTTKKHVLQLRPKRKDASRLPVDISVTMTPRDGIKTLLNEVKEVIELPRFNAQDVKKVVDVDAIVITDEIVSQLRDYVTTIALKYQSNPFHNFEHASHVVMAIHKLLSRVVTPEQVDYSRSSVSKIASDLHDYTFGITSDPLTHFSVVLSALIHDVDHTGVSNGQLAEERPDLADLYRSQRYGNHRILEIATCNSCPLRSNIEISFVRPASFPLVLL